MIISRTGDRWWGVQRSRPWLSALVVLLGLGVLLSFAFWLRWQYIQSVSYNVDEFNSLWAAQRTLEMGAPLMPSGVLYTRGLLSSYLIAGALGLGGATYVTGRLPSLFFGLLTLLLIFYVGSRAWNARVGWIAALGYTMLTDAIIWSGRARFYAPLMFFSLLTLWLAFVALRQDDGRENQAYWRPHLLFALCFVLSLFSLEQTALLYPSLLMAMVLWRGWAYLRQLPVLVAHGICLLAIALRFLLEQWGQPGYFAAIQEYKSYLGPLIASITSWLSIRDFFFHPLNTPWTLCVLIAAGVVLVQVWRQRGRLTALAPTSQATLFFALHLFAMLVYLVTVVGPGWVNARYFVIVIPAWLLIAAAGATGLIDRMTPHVRLRWGITALLIALIVPFMWPQTVDAIDDEGEGYDAVFAYVAEHRQPGDVVMSPAPSACAVGMGRPCDYYVMQHSWEPYVIQRNGEWVDRWSGAKLLNTSEQLIAVLQSARRVWFVTDSRRLGRRHQEDFIYLVLQQFDFQTHERDVTAMLSNGWSDPPVIEAKAMLDPPVPFGDLQLTRWERGSAQPGQPFYMAFFWQKVGSLKQQINTSLQVVAADGAHITQRDGPPARGMTNTYDFGDIDLPDLKQLQLPADLPSGRYRLDVVAYDAHTLEPVSEPTAVDWLWIGPPAPTPAMPLAVWWQNGLQLVGRDRLPAELAPGEMLDLRLVWSASRPQPAAYTVFVHLVGPDGKLVAQADRAPENGFYPTSSWDVDEMVADHYALLVPASLPAGEYRLLVGLYLPSTGERLRRPQGADTYEIAHWLQN
jgi:hypothetical protein